MIEISTDDRTQRIKAILTAFPNKVRGVYNAGIKEGSKFVNKQVTTTISKTYAIKPADVRNRKNTTVKIKQIVSGGMIQGYILQRL